jgi:hypothetical protein
MEELDRRTLLRRAPGSWPARASWPGWPAASRTGPTPPYLRLGPSIVTSEADVDAAVAAVRALT